MCTAMSFKTKDFYFGRNLDLEYCYKEAVTVMPRNFSVALGKEEVKNHYAIIGMAYIQDGYPLFYDGVNEKGLAIAGLNFPCYCKYRPFEEGKKNVASFEFIPWILCRCKSTEEAEKEIENMNITDEAFDEKLQVSPLHWIISDREKSITVECTEDGLKVYQNDVGVLTNSPTFDYHRTNLNNYFHISQTRGENRFSDDISFLPYSKGMGALGIPGDYSSASRFVKATFLKTNSVCGESEEESVNQFFHILDNVSFVRGCVNDGEGYEITQYTSVMNADKGKYYYTTYNSRQIKCHSMYDEDLNASSLSVYPI